MKCLKCGFISYDYLERCKKCGKPLPKATQKSLFPSFKNAIKGEPKIISKKEESKKTSSYKESSDDIVQISGKISPVPDIEPISKASTKSEDLRKQFLPIISDNDDYNLITNKTYESFSLENLPILSRFFSFLIDISILLIINAILIFLSLLIVKASIGAVLALKFYFILLFLLIHYLYYVYFTVIFQATPGKMILKLKTISLTNLNSTKLSFSQASWRWLALIGGIAFFFVGIFYMIIDENHAALHDRLSLSLVIKEEQFDLMGRES